MPKVEVPSPPPGRFVLQHPQAVDSATLAADGRTVALNGIVALPDPSGGLQRYLRAQGDEVACDVQGSGYACVLPDGTDVALVSLANGAARATPDAPASYREQEAAAQAARRGVWASLPPPPVTVAHPAARTSALLTAGGAAYPLDGLQGLPGRPAQELQGYIAAHGDSVTCQQQPGGRAYVCTLPDGTDVAMVALVNGAARLAPEASASYRVQQDQAVANRRGIWATGLAPVPAVLGPAPASVPRPAVPSYPPPGVPADATPGYAGDAPPGGVAVLGGQPTAVIDGEQAFFVFGGAGLGWGYWDRLRHWHGAPDRYAGDLGRLPSFRRSGGYAGIGPAGFVPGAGRGGFVPGQSRYVPAYAPTFVRPGPAFAPPSFGRPAFAAGGFGQPVFGRPAFGQRPFGQAGYGVTPFGRPGFAPVGGRPALAVRPAPALPGTPPCPARCGSGSGRCFPCRGWTPPLAICRVWGRRRVLPWLGSAMAGFVPFNPSQAFLRPPDLNAWPPHGDLAHFVVAATERVPLAAVVAPGRTGSKPQHQPSLYRPADALTRGNRVKGDKPDLPPSAGPETYPDRLGASRAHDLGRGWSCISRLVQRPSSEHRCFIRLSRHYRYNFLQLQGCSVSVHPVLSAQPDGKNGMVLMVTRRGLALGAACLAAAPRYARAADGTIKIGAMTPLTGAAVEAGKLQQNGIRIALEAVNRMGVLGRKFEIVTEDDQTTNPGAARSFGRLAARPDIAAIIGPSRSEQVNAVEGEARKLGKPFMFGGTDPTLTQRDNPWLFRCRPSASYSATIIAEFGFGQLQKSKWAIVSSAEAFGISASKALQAALAERSITPVLVESCPNQTADFSQVVKAVGASGADILVTFITLEADVGLFGRQLRQAGVMLPWVGSPSITSVQARTIAGDALFGSFGIADYALDGTPTSGVFGNKYNALFGAVPDHQAAYAHDAVLLLARAITAANGTEPDRVRTALLAIKGFAAAEGEYNFDDKGEGLRGYNIVKNEKGELVFDRRIEVELT